MVGDDPDLMLQLPDTTGLKNEILIQKKQRYSYDRSYTVAGGKLIEVGDDDGCTPAQLEAAIGPNTAAVVYYIQPDWDDSVVSLEDTVKIAHDHGVKVIADAASQIYPLDYMLGNASAADLVCFGAKVPWRAARHRFRVRTERPGGRGGCQRLYRVPHGGPQGYRTAVEGNAARHYRCYRGTRRMVHDEPRRSPDRHRQQAILYAGAACRACNTPSSEVVRHDRFWGSTLHVVLDSASGKTAQDVARELDEGDPRIWVNTIGEDTVTFNAHTLNPGEDEIIVQRIQEIIS